MTDEILDELFSVIQERKQTLPDNSYTTTLLTDDKGENIILEKLGEEMTELIIASKDENRASILHESADLVYHLLVLLVVKDIDIDELRDELRSRRG